MEMLKGGINCEIKEVENRVLEFVGSNEFIDRDGEIISADGWDLKNYKKNPVILFAHDYRQPAVAKATKISVQDGNLMFRVQFPEEKDYPFADTIYKLYKGGYMNATSVGFIPKEWTNGAEGEKFRRKYTKQELLELSLVPVPSNPTALITSRSLLDAWQKGVVDEKEWNGFTSKVLESVNKPEPEVTENEIRIRIRPPSMFKEDSFRTITVSSSRGIKFIIGRFKEDDGSTHVQSVRFDKEKWTVGEAQGWVREHRDSMKFFKRSIEQDEEIISLKSTHERTIRELREEIDKFRDRGYIQAVLRGSGRETTERKGQAVLDAMKTIAKEKRQ